MKNFQFEIIYGILATAGGIARYLSEYNRSGKFAMRHFIASTAISGFSGYMFALLGISLDLPQTFLFMMAGTGGFMGEQALKFISEYVTNKIK